MKLAERKPEELRAWLEEDPRNKEVTDYFLEQREDLVRSMISAARAGNAVQYQAGGIDLVDKFRALFERKTEKK